MQSNGHKDPEFLDGEVLRRAEVAGLFLGEVRYAAASKRAVHTHERACFHFLLQGGYVESQGNESQECTTPALAFQPKGHRHSYQSAGGVSLSFTVELEDAWLARLRDYSVKLDSPDKFQGGALSWLMARLYSEFRSMDAASPLVMEALAAEISVEASRRSEHLAGRIPPRWLTQVRDQIHDRFAHPLSLHHIAASAGVHPVHVARVFRRHYHCTVGEYVRRLRIEFACQQMIQTKATLVEIALASGFSDQSQFSRAFKRELGLTPARFRAARRPR